MTRNNSSAIAEVPLTAEENPITTFEKTSPIISKGLIIDPKTKLWLRGIRKPTADAHGNIALSNKKSSPLFKKGGKGYYWKLLPTYLPNRTRNNPSKNTHNDSSKNIYNISSKNVY